MVRFGNVVPARMGCRAIYDLIRKQKASSRELEILGDGPRVAARRLLGEESA